MVIGPKKSLETITEEESKQLEALEKKIDKELRKKFQGRYLMVFGNQKEIPRRYALETLLDKYRAEGWKKVTIEYHEGGCTGYSDTYCPPSYSICLEER
ncbi:hypothetical protein JW711_04055 [Candidatus Woesearchaeota archaeon]|nr:hypothetical protein [Candidatus Woesearchaeota archaeon]